MTLLILLSFFQSAIISLLNNSSGFAFFKFRHKR